MPPEARQAWLCPRCPNVTDVIGDSATCAGALTLGTAHDPCPMVLGVASAPEGRQWTITRSHPMHTQLDGPRLELGESVSVYEHPPADDRETPPEAICNRCRAPKGLHAVGESCNGNCGGKVVVNPEAERVARERLRAENELSERLREVEAPSDELVERVARALYEGHADPEAVSDLLPYDEYAGMWRMSARAALKAVSAALARGAGGDTG